MNKSSKQLPADYDWRKSFSVAESLSMEALGQEKAARGREFERILSGMFAESGLRPRLGYRPSGEEVDGSFWLHGRTMLLEAKWTAEPHPASSLYQFKGKVDGKLVGTLGLFVSMAGFSTDSIDALLVGKELNLVLMDGDDVRAVVANRMTMAEAIEVKLRAAGESGTPFFPLSMSSDRKKQHGQKFILVEGRFDARILEMIREEYAVSTKVTFLPTGGPRNMVPLAQSLMTTLDAGDEMTLVVDEDGLKPSVMKDLRNVVELANEVLSAQMLVMPPDLDAAFGVVPPNSTWNERLKLRRMSDSQLSDVVSKIDISTMAAREPAVPALLSSIGVPVQL